MDTKTEPNAGAFEANFNTHSRLFGLLRSPCGEGDRKRAGVFEIRRKRPQTSLSPRREKAVIALVEAIRTKVQKGELD